MVHKPGSGTQQRLTESMADIGMEAPSMVRLNQGQYRTNSEALCSYENPSGAGVEGYASMEGKIIALSDGGEGATDWAAASWRAAATEEGAGG